MAQAPEGAGPALARPVPMRPTLRYVALLGALAGVYFVAGKLGLRLALVHASATAVWPPTGITLAAFLIFGVRVWPGILAGAFLVNLTTEGSVATSLGIAAGNTLEGLVGTYLVNRFAGGLEVFERARDVFKFVLLAAVMSTTVSATCGVTSLSLSGFAEWEDAGPIWLTWWLGDASGALILTPALVLWWRDPRVRWTRARALEAALLLIGLVVTGLVFFSGLVPSWFRNHPLAFVSIPFFIWAAFRFGPREAASTILVLAGLAVWGTLSGHGPFTRPDPNESLLLLQSFLGVAAVMTDTLAAVVSERGRVEHQLRQLAITDAVTGLANYRHLIATLDQEIRRSRRTDRPFAILFFDLDGLKQINDRHGHLVGTEALRRLAHVLRRSSRAIDTAARFGGDEFALILPESDEGAARHVARRIVEQLRNDGDQPSLSVSVGVAAFPGGGETPEALLGQADRLLYQAKARGGGGLPPPDQGGQAGP